MKEYDYIVVGGGIAGLTVSQILGLQGAPGGRVLLLEKAATLGGSAARFRLGGVPFDVGFHFTGGFTPDGKGVLDDMLRLLRVRERVRPIYYPHDGCHRMLFPSLGASILLPSGLDNTRAALKREFPRQQQGIDRYFDRFARVVDCSPLLSVSGFDGEFPPPLPEDGVSLQQVLDELISDPLLQAVLGGFCMCHGARPAEVSFATHCRISFGLHESLARVEDGGQAFVDALSAALAQSRVEVRTGVTIAACGQIEKRTVKSFTLTDGSEVRAKACVFTIHPRQILATLPHEHLSKAFQQRVEDLEPSIGFFAVFGELDGRGDAQAEPIVSILPGTDLNAMLGPQSGGPVDGPLVVLRSAEQVGGRSMRTVSVLEVALPQWTARWASSQTGRRPAEYYRFKQARADSILRRVRASLPDCASGLRVLDTASMLTFRDYLHSVDGAAYGIRQKMGQINVMGRLPLSNLYAAGQCALLPGIIGAMTSGFLVCRSLLGHETFCKYLAGARSC